MLKKKSKSRQDRIILAELDEIPYRILKKAAKAISEVPAIHLGDRWRMGDVPKD